MTETCPNCNDVTCEVVAARGDLKRIDSGATYHPEAWEALRAAEKACAVRARSWRKTLTARAVKAEATIERVELLLMRLRNAALPVDPQFIVRKFDEALAGEEVLTEAQLRARMIAQVSDEE